MEHRSDNGKYYCESRFNYDLFSYRDDWWLLGDSLSNCVSGHWPERNSVCLSVNCVFGVIKHNYRQWCNQLPVEYRANYGEHYRQSDADDYLHGDR